MREKIKQPMIYFLWNLCMWGIVLINGIVEKYVQEQIKMTAQINWAYLAILFQICTWIGIGLGIGWLITRNILSTKGITLEIGMIIVPNVLLMIMTFPIPMEVVTPTQFFIIAYMDSLRALGGLIIGVEIVKFIKHLRID